MWSTEYLDLEAHRFATEQEYIDFAFIMIVLYNFSTLLQPRDLLQA